VGELNNQVTREKRDHDLLVEGKKRYVGELSKQVELLEKHVATYEVWATFEAAEKIYRIVHSLKGSAPIFGFTRLGASAEQLVQLFEWTQAERGQDTVVPALSVETCKSLVSQIRMEHLIGQKEIELDERKEREHQAPLLRKQFRLLFIDDDDVLRSFLVRRLQLDGYQVDDVPDVSSAKKKLHEKVYDLVILDLMMQPESGYVLFDFLQEDPTLKWIPLVVLSGRESVQDKVKCYHLGADQYITKPFHYEELEASIYRLLMRTKHFEEMAFLDPLTGVFNRRYFDHQLQLEIQRSERASSRLSIAFIDIDRFKRINDTYGHHVGDLVLQGLSHVLQKHLRSTDLLARYGGEEFVIAFPDTSAEQAAEILNTILRHIRQAPVVQYEGQYYRITFSAGIAEWDRSQTADEWIQRADSAMYTAKQQGRNQVCAAAGMLFRQEAHESANHQRTATKRVLLADDDTMIRSIIKAKLDHLNLQFLEAADGEQALNILTNEPVDLCILDGIMPIMDGFELLSTIRKSDKWADLKVLMLSGKKQEADVVRGLTLGANEYMSKPFSIVELEMSVKRLLGM